MDDVMKSFFALDFKSRQRVCGRSVVGYYNGGPRIMPSLGVITLHSPIHTSSAAARGSAWGHQQPLRRQKFEQHLCIQACSFQAVAGTLNLPCEQA